MSTVKSTCKWSPLFLPARLMQRTLSWHLWPRTENWTRVERDTSCIWSWISQVPKSGTPSWKMGCWDWEGVGSTIAEALGNCVLDSSRALERMFSIAFTSVPRVYAVSFCGVRLFLETRAILLCWILLFLQSSFLPVWVPCYIITEQPLCSTWGGQVFL